MKLETKLEKIQELITQGKISASQGFMYAAMIKSELSMDPNTKVGAIIVRDNKIISTGTNRAVKGFENNINWENRNMNNWLESKYPYIVHSERDAIYKAKNDGISLFNSELYVTLYPCNECAIAIVENGIKALYYFGDKYHDADNTIASRRILTSSGIKVQQICLEKNTYDIIKEYLEKEKTLTLKK